MAHGFRHRASRVVLALTLGTGLATRPPGVHADSLLGSVGPDAWWQRLGDPDPRVRRGAADLMGRYAAVSPRPPAELYNRFVREDDPSVQLALVAAIARGRRPLAACTLLRIAQDDRDRGTRGAAPAARASAIVALGALAHQPDIADDLANHCARVSSRLPAQVSVVAGVLWGSSGGPSEVLEAEARALASEPEPGFAHLLEATRGGLSRSDRLLRAIALRGDPRWASVALEQLRNPSPVVIAAALDAIAALHASDAVPDVAEIARTAADRGLRRRALATLATLGTRPDADVLRAALASPATRDAAMEACERVGDRACVREVIPWLNAAWVRDRRTAAETLGALGGLDAGAALRAAVATERDVSVRRALLHAVARLGTDEALAWLARVDEPAARWALAEAAVRGAPVHPVASSFERALHAAEPAAVVLAGVLGVHRPWLRALLASADVSQRVAAAVAMANGSGGDAADASALITALAREDDEGARVAFAMALSRVGGEAAGEALAVLLAREATQPALATLVAADAVTRGAVPGAAEALRAMLREPGASARTRAAAARALGATGDALSIATVREAARFDPDPDARGAALIALAELAGASARVDLLDGRTLAWTPRLFDHASRALAIADGLAPRHARFDGRSVVRLAGASPRSVHVSWRPDGSPSFAVALADGEVFLTGAPSGAATIERLDTP